MARASAWVMVLALWASIAVGAVPGLDPPAKPSAPRAVAAAPPADLQPGQVDGLVATMSDAQVRRLLVDTLRQEAETRRVAAQADEAGDAAQLLTGLRARIRHIGESLTATRAAAADWRDHWEVVLRNLTDDEGWPAVGSALLVLAMMFAAGAAAEFALARVLPQAHPHAPVAGEAEHPWLHRLSGAALVLLIRLVRIAVFMAVAFAASYLVYETFNPMRELLLAALAWVIGMRLWFAVSVLALAPRAPAARLIPISDAASRRLHYSGVVLFAWVSAGFLAYGLFKILGLEPRLLDLSRILTGAVFTVMLVACILLARGDVHRALTAPGTSRLAHAVARTWLALVIGYLALAWAFWAVNVLEGDNVGAAAAVRSLGILLAVPLIDRLAGLAFGRLLRDRLGPDGVPMPRFAKARRIAQSVLRSLLLLAAVILLVQAWGGELMNRVGTPFGTTVLRAAFSVTVALLLTWVAWEAIAHFIDRRLAAAPTGDDTASREKTLLPLLRRFLIGVLVAMVTMIVLSSIGIDIGPLLAGAGIVGIAIGFGAQTLVRDIMSGLFFLIDDAFRVGEYVDLGRLRGTVERITVRALVLRHHRGALHTVPFGQIQAITNYNRDWLIDKVEMRLNYDVDVDRVKKLIKQIGVELQNDPELGPKLIETLKSQGISRFEAGGMVLRAKFMCKPREQFVVRREALKRIKAVFAANGIQFADTSVTVRGDGMVSPMAAAAAATAANDATARPTDAGSATSA